MMDQFIEAMDLERPNLLICKYGYVDGKIVIEEIDVVDNENKFIRKADLLKVVPYLRVSNVKFYGKDI